MEAEEDEDEEDEAAVTPDDAAAAAEAAAWVVAMERARVRLMRVVRRSLKPRVAS